VSNKSKVVLIPCFDYEEDKVFRAMQLGISLLGGIERFVSTEEEILVKPNFLHPDESSRAVTTHPAVIKAMLRILSESGYSNVMFGDSPARGSCRSAAKALGLEDGIFGARIADMSEPVEVALPGGTTAESFYFAKEVTEADAVINLCKMKTHALERITGAVKNLYGLVCGSYKAAGHVRFPNDTVFARMLTDIHKAKGARLHIMDGVVAMQGNGPSSGDPVNMNVLLFSDDPVALDTVYCWLIYLDPLLVPTNEQGQVCGIGTCTEAQMEVVIPGENGGTRTISREELQKLFGNPDFQVSRKGKPLSFLGLFSKFMTGLSRPVIDQDKCIRCGVCVSHCPVTGGAVHFDSGRDKPPVYDYSKCIRCYCCQELCPAHAIKKR